jgi:hypothetical protein
MATAKTAARKKPASRRRPAARTPVSRRPPRQHGVGQRLAAWFANWLARHAANHRDSVRSRRDAAILRQTHANCTTCHGTGTIFTKGKHGEFTGSKPCPARPATLAVSKTRVAIGARMGVDKHSGLVGWRCPCGKKEKPRHRDAKTATAALRTHERAKHGGVSVGGAWYAQLPEGAQPVSQPAAAKPAAPTAPPVSKKITDSGMTDQEWILQNTPLSPKAADRKGVCWQCAGQGKIHFAFGGQQGLSVCSECNGKGTSKTTTARTT